MGSRAKGGDKITSRGRLTFGGGRCGASDSNYTRISKFHVIIYMLCDIICTSNIKWLSLCIKRITGIIEVFVP